MTDTTIKLNLKDHPSDILPSLAELGVITWEAAAKAALYQAGWTDKQITQAMGHGAWASPVPAKAKTNGAKTNGVKTNGKAKAKPSTKSGLNVPGNFDALWNDLSRTLDALSAELQVPVSTMRRWAVERDLPQRPRGRRPRMGTTPKEV